MGSRPRFRNVLAHVRALRPDIPDPIGAIRARRLVVGGVVILDPATLVRSDSGVMLRPARSLRGSAKLEAALDRCLVDVDDAVCLDVGTAAGGFTTVLLRGGARRVYALDAGNGQLRGDLRVDPRVVNLERTNLADAPRVVPAEPLVDLVTADLSYISLSDALPQLEGVSFSRSAHLIALVKPMFELGRDRAPVDEASICPAVDSASRGAITAGWRGPDWFRSPILGSKGAREAFIHAVREEAGTVVPTGFEPVSPP
jgi:23S rRNA (cytidine1920-2'-O)/16S rRNA (cytidine1409-2'-O)-methyltransferase